MLEDIASFESAKRAHFLAVNVVDMNIQYSFSKSNLAELGEDVLVPLHEHSALSCFEYRTCTHVVASWMSAASTSMLAANTIIFGDNASLAIYAKY